MAPMASLKLLVDYLRSGGKSDTSIKDLISAGLDVAKWVTDTFFADGPVLMQAGVITDAQLADVLESQYLHGSPENPAGAFPWQIVLPLVIDLIQKWLESRK